MEQQLAFSFHLGSDKNKSKSAKKVAKGNVSSTTSLSNNAIQNIFIFYCFSHKSFV